MFDQVHAVALKLVLLGRSDIFRQTNDSFAIGYFGRLGHAQTVVAGRGREHLAIAPLLGKGEGIEGAAIFKGAGYLKVFQLHPDLGLGKVRHPVTDPQGRRGNMACYALARHQYVTDTQSLICHVVPLLI